MKQWIFVCTLAFATSVFAAKSEDEQGVLAENQLESESLDKKAQFPLGASFSVTNSVGIGTFVPGYRQTPLFTTSLFFSPHYNLPQFWHAPQMVLSAGVSMDVAWLDSYQTSVSDYIRRPKFSDVSLSLAMPKGFVIDQIGLSFMPRIGAIFPASAMSRALNRLVGLSIGGTVQWKKSDFAIGWSPGFTGYIHSGPAKTLPCNYTNLPPVINPYDSDFALEDYMLGFVAGRGDQRNSDGTCNVSGRQALGILKNALSVSYSPSRHSLSAGVEWHIAFLRPLADAPDLQGTYASGQNFTEAVLGKIAYSYQLPVAFDLALSGGVLSYQASYAKNGNINFPFFDFVTPGKNQTQFFVDVQMGI